MSYRARLSEGLVSVEMAEQLEFSFPSLSFALTSLAIAPRAAEARYSCRSHVACPQGFVSGWDGCSGGLATPRMAPAHWAAEVQR